MSLEEDLIAGIQADYQYMDGLGRPDLHASSHRNLVC